MGHSCDYIILYVMQVNISYNLWIVNYRLIPTARVRNKLISIGTKIRPKKPIKLTNQVNVFTKRVHCFLLQQDL